VNDLNLSIGTLFPISTGALYFSAGFKYRVLKREKHFLGLAVAGSVSFLQDETAGTITGILGIGNRRRSLNLSVHDLFTQDDSVGFFVVGGDYQIAHGAKLLLEYANGTAAFTDEEDFSGFINVGFRLFSSRSSFTLTGFRPLEEGGEDFILFPLAMFSRHW
jgi:hypothetical protein